MIISIFHRKTLMKITTTVQNFCISLDDTCDDLPPPPPPPPPLSQANHNLSPLKILMICSLASCFSFVCYLIIIKICSAFRNRSRSRNTNDNTNHETRDQDHIVRVESSVVFHPIWLINTIGLDQSVIDSIEVFKYRKKHGHDSKDCAVCLGEFQDDETLRMLPKCSHVFHVTCIDTWLRSHVNCPVCRAPIVSNNDNDNIHDQVDHNSIDSSTDDEEIIIPGDHDLGDVMRDENAPNIEKKYMGKGVRVQSDLRDYYCCDQQLEPMRRSVSMSGSRELVVLNDTNGVEKSEKRRGLSSSISMINSTHRAMKSSSFGVRSGDSFKSQSL